MKLPNTETITFEQYLNIKQRFVSKSIKFLSSATWEELKENGFTNKKEVKELLRFQRNEMRDIIQMKKYNNPQEIKNIPMRERK